MGRFSSRVDTDDEKQQVERQERSEFTKRQIQQEMNATDGAEATSLKGMKTGTGVITDRQTDREGGDGYENAEKGQKTSVSQPSSQEMG